MNRIRFDGNAEQSGYITGAEYQSSLTPLKQHDSMRCIAGPLYGDRDNVMTAAKSMVADVTGAPKSIARICYGAALAVSAMLDSEHEKAATPLQRAIQIIDETHCGGWWRGATDGLLDMTCLRRELVVQALRNARNKAGDLAGRRRQRLRRVGPPRVSPASGNVAE